ncbi:MAG: L-fucose mutarotase [Candidatus Latescibacterota bacterium]|nr:L-fucose mutarotase [Candidatus Latescibacterota bacterium]
MLVGISPLMSPEMLATIYRMGHGDELVLADAHFPGHSCNVNVVRADGLMIPDLLEAILPLMVLDSYVDYPALIMEPVPGDTADPSVRENYEMVLSRYSPHAARVGEIERFSFYERTSEAYAVIMTGDTTKYGNILLKKGVTPVEH